MWTYRDTGAAMVRTAKILKVAFWSRVLVASGLAALMVFAVGALATPDPAWAAPPYAKSYYVTSYSTSWAYNEGCALGTQDKNTSGTQKHVAVLDFGKLYLSSSGTWMVGLFTGTDVSLASARGMAEQFVKGYWICTEADLSSTVYVAMGTNNCTGTITSSAGAAMAAQAYAGWNNVQNNGWSQGFVIGANDFESWVGSNCTPVSASAARAWIDGYNGATNKVFFVNYGGADGCPTTSVPSAGGCNSVFPAETIWRVSWSGLAYPLPEIYTTSGSQASQWKYLSLYSYLNHGSKFTFKGVMTQAGACNQAGPCSGTNNGPSTGWSQLNTAVNTDSRTATTPDGPTDIRWK